MNLETAWRLIQTDPRTLLDTAFVALAGGNEQSRSEAAVFAISKPDELQGLYARTDGTGLPGFRVSLLQGEKVVAQRYTSGGTEHRTFAAFYIAMKRMGAGPGDAPAGTYFALPGAGGGSDICITSQLSGCTFGIGSQVGGGGSCLVSHIQPHGPLGAAQPVMAAQTTALFGQAPDTLVEKGATYGDRAHVIGQRVHGHWFFFIQKFRAGFTRQVEPVADL